MASVVVQSSPNNQGFTQDANYKGTALTCISCKMMFPTAKDQREHYKTDLHRFNLKRKVANLPPVTKEVFELKVKGTTSS
jgi:pre-60S factor REI1